MGRPFVSLTCAINGASLLFLPFDFELSSWSIFRNIYSMPSMVTELSLVTLEMLLGQFLNHQLIPLQMDTDIWVPFDWWIFIFCCVQFYQPRSWWNMLFRMLDDYWDDLLLVRSRMGQILPMFYWYLFSRQIEYFSEKYRCMNIVVAEVKKLTVIKNNNIIKYA